jgi:hypothetical protein
MLSHLGGNYCVAVEDRQDMLLLGTIVNAAEEEGMFVALVECRFVVQGIEECGPDPWHPFSRVFL